MQGGVLWVDAGGGGLWVDAGQCVLLDGVSISMEQLLPLGADN
jgi:hypothetical protein